MTDFFSLLAGTVLLRPYVFIFLALYLTLAWINMGGIRTLLFTVLAYGIAFLSEYSSTRNGFPYGFYSYIETTRNRELWVSNVPFMDSLSYSFLSYLSYTLSLLFWSPLEKNGGDLRWKIPNPVKHSARVIVTGALLFMLMDVIIDPVAFRGDRWFLGKIYTYQEEGAYFNIPLTNFGGWFLVGLAILGSFCALDRGLDRVVPVRPRRVPYQALWGPALYFGVLAFNLAVTFYIGEVGLGLCGLLICSAILSLVVYKTKFPAKLGTG